MAVSAQAKIPSQLGRSAVVTGATGGLGYETALALAKAGAEAILTGRNDRKGQSAIEKIRLEVPDARISYEPRSVQPRVDRRFLAADAFPTVAGSPDKQCRSDGAAAPANHGRRL
jgi:NAD(P)-dependent dehydrogenase (short-subunit alcohol dehydrogenase family)